MKRRKQVIVISIIIFNAKPTEINQDPSIVSEITAGTYTNNELGISFEYPNTLGKATEFKDYYDKLSVVRIQGETNLPGDIELYYTESQSLTTCEDAFKYGFPGKGTSFPTKCETRINAKNKTIQVLEFKENTNTKSILFQTQKGVWNLMTNDENKFDYLTQIGDSIKDQ
jgi:hypothetical protein